MKSRSNLEETIIQFVYLKQPNVNLTGTHNWGQWPQNIFRFPISRERNLAIRVCVRVRVNFCVWPSMNTDTEYEANYMSLGWWVKENSP